MKLIKTKFSGLKIVKLRKNQDARGYLAETYRKKLLKGKDLVFDYKVLSKKNVFRGFHFQYNYQQVKFISVLKGKILDCVIDLRKNSKTFGKIFKIILSEKNALSLYVPAGFAHSYLTLDKENIVYYKLSNYYKPKYESGIIWNDKDLKIRWPIKKPKVSKKDKNLPTYKNFLKTFKYL
jgi:dTDP-4-dehydrorhamnose 3,5-epimerase